MTFEHLQSAADDGITRKQHTCVQAFVSVDDKTHLNAAFGEAAAGVSATAQTIMLWRSAGKPLMAAGRAGRVICRRCVKPTSFVDVEHTI